MVTTVADAKIDAATGIFSWTPTELHGPGTYTFKVKVSDGSLTDEEEFQIKVNEVNQAPLLATIGNYEVKLGSTLQFKLTASDADIPVQKLTYSANKLPTGAVLNASTGEFSWKPASGQEDSYKIIFKVSDGVAQTTQQTTITVTKQQVAAPTITYFQPAIGKVGQDVVIRGTNFVGVTAVYFNNVSASFTLVNSTHIMAKVPVGAKTGKVSVVAAGGKAVSSTNFTVLTENTFPPVINGFTPGRGGVGSKVVIKGLNLKNTTMVKFGSSVANYKVDVNGVITTYVPQVSVSLPASMYISVTTSAGTATSKEQFIVTSPYNKSKYNRVTTLNAPEKSIQEIEVYPNPIIDKATINLTLQESGNYRISLFDDMGKMVSVLEQGTAEAGKSRTLELDGSKLAKGLYLIRLEHKTGGSTIKVIIDK
ncbi:putative Ig domain-containing protein [Pontibacter populi]|uniref:Ig domain-containing protein n=1 Tax=Pontibacter populi TaxID=890055 RepID=A0ABV1RWJ3_9BACT